MNRFVTLIALLAGAVGSVSAPLAAADDGADAQLRAIAVHFSRTELRNRDGVVRLYHRLSEAAHEACEDYDSVELTRQRVFQLCVSLALDRAVTQINDPALSAYDLHQEPRPVAVAALHR
jgi:UrcA family protein